MHRSALVFLFAAAAACGDSDGADDDGGTDAAIGDGGDDAGGADADLTDADLTDADLTDAGPSSTRHTARPSGYLDAPQAFWEYVPPGYAPTGAGSPLLIAFHGLGENGDGGAAALPLVLRVGPARLIDRDEWPATRPFVVLSPQQATSCPSPTSIAAFLAWAQAHYNVDASRIYLTGLSCGAIGIANYLRVNVATTPVAAVVAISGDWRSAWSNQMCALGRVPIWAIHGDADTNGGTLPDFSRLPITELLACPAPPRTETILTMLPGVGHTGAAWNDSYAGNHGFDVFAWMLTHTR